MASTNIPNRVVPVLEAYALYFLTTGSRIPPQNIEIARSVGLSASTVATYLPVLQGAGLMDLNNFVTEAGYQWLDDHGIMVPTSIPIIGKVQAGNAEFGTLTRYIESFDELMSSTVDRLIVPKVRNPRRTLAMEVRGDSMEQANIFEGDYVFVELFLQDETARNGELIVARYVRSSRVQHLKESLIDAPSADEEVFLEGYTVKYFYEQTGCYRLTPHRNTYNDHNVIFASSVRVLGRVIGVYRPLV